MTPRPMYNNLEVSKLLGKAVTAVDEARAIILGVRESYGIIEVEGVFTTIASARSYAEERNKTEPWCGDEVVIQVWRDTTLIKEVIADKERFGWNWHTVNINPEEGI